MGFLITLIIIALVGWFLFKTFRGQSGPGDTTGDSGVTQQEKLPGQRAAIDGEVRELSPDSAGDATANATTEPSVADPATPSTSEPRADRSASGDIDMSEQATTDESSPEASSDEDGSNIANPPVADNAGNLDYRDRSQSPTTSESVPDGATATTPAARAMDTPSAEERANQPLESTAGSMDYRDRSDEPADSDGNLSGGAATAAALASGVATGAVARSGANTGSGSDGQSTDRSSAEVVSMEQLSSGDTGRDVREMIKVLNLREGDAARLDIEKDTFQKIWSGNSSEVDSDTLDRVAERLRRMLA